MRKNYLKLFITSLILTLHSCSVSKALYKKGIKLEEAGMYKEASNFYYDALKKDVKNIDATIALKKVGLRIYQEHIDDMSMANKQGNHKNAVYSYLKAEDFRKKLSSVNVNISKDKTADMSFNESKKIYSDKLLDKSNNLMAEEKFKEAEVYLNELVKLNPENQNIQEMRAMSYSEPIYREGLKNMETEQYRKAYFNFKKITNYKDSKDLQKLSQSNATFKIAIIPLRNNTSRIELTDKLYGNIFKSIFDKNDPFLQILDQNQVRSILNDRGINISDFNNNNPKFLNAMSQAFGVNAFLRGTITSANYKKNDIVKNKKIAFERYYTKRKDPKTRKTITKTNYKKISYDEFTGSNNVNISFNYSLISKDGVVVLSDAISRTTQHSIRYSTYKGDYKNLYPLIGSTYTVSRNKVNSFRKDFTANRNLKSITILENEGIFSISNKLANKLTSYNPEK